MENYYLGDFVRSQKIKIALIIFGLVIVVFFVFFPMLENGFVYDDAVRIQNNINFRTPHGFWEFFKNPSLYGSEKSVEDTYRPLSTYFLYLQYQMFGQEAFGYHATSLMLHIFNAVLVFFLLKKLFNNENCALGGGLAFALHPVTTETVAWAFQQSGLWSWMFLLLTLFFGLFLPDSRRVLKLIILFLTSLLSVFFKEQAVVLAGLYFLIILLFEHTKSNLSINLNSLWLVCQKYYLEFIVLILPVIVYLFTRTKYLGQIGQNIKLAFWPHLGGIIVESLARYYKLLVFPHPLLVNHDDLLKLLQWNSFNFIASSLTLIVIIAAVFYFRKKEPTISIGLVWVFIVLLPVSNIIFQTKQAMNERFLYLGVFGVVIACAGVIMGLIKKFGETKPLKQIIIYGLLAILVIFVFLDNKRLHDWQNNLSLWAHEIKYSPKSARAQLYYGTALEENNRSYDAAQYYLNAIPYASVPKSFFMFRAGMAYLRAGEFGNASKIAKEGKIEFPDQSVFWELEGRVNIEQNKYKDAEENFLKIGEMNKGVDKPLAFYIILARILQQQKETEAFKGFEQQLTVEEQKSYYLVMTGKKYLLKKDFESARNSLIQGLTTTVFSVKEPYLWLALSAEKLGDFENAKLVYELLNQLFLGSIEATQGLSGLYD
jgi:tetratricopeptide (TPR) repeat protein